MAGAETDDGAEVLGSLGAWVPVLRCLGAWVGSRFTEPSTPLST